MLTQGQIDFVQSLHPAMKIYLTLPDGTILFPHFEDWGCDYGLGYINRCLHEGIMCKQPDGSEIDPHILLKKV